MSQDHNMVSVSGGKDSTALLLLAIERETEWLEAVFADTGNEHKLTYDYMLYLADATGVQRKWVKADFSAMIANKAAYVRDVWPKKGVPQEAIDRAIAALVPSGNPFLDLCLWKGRFPSAMAAFCSEHLKRIPIQRVQSIALDAGEDVISWQGVRRDESRRRALLTERELVKVTSSGAELWNFRPILDWSAEDCFVMHKRHGIKHNPLYEMGMGRVGCMPCINCRKDELLEISKRFPREIDRIRQSEIAVQHAAKRRRLAIETAKWPTTLEEVPEAEWPRAPFVPEGLTKVFRSRDFHVQVYSAEAQAIYRITVGRTVLDSDAGRWRDGITWDELQRIKRECGFGAYHAVEVFPADCDLVNVANLRHLWILHDPPAFAWRRGG